MTPTRFLPALLALPAVLLASEVAHAIVAPGCGSGPACGVGFECTVVGASGCAPTPACPPGESCPDPEPCEVTQEYGCTPAHCQSNADCASGMVCFEHAEGCAVSDCACAPGEKCDCAEPAPCEPTKVSMCTPRYLLPCEAAADCGPGFTCDTVMSCGCSGSGGDATPPSPEKAPVPPSEGGAAPADAAPIPPDCSCEPSGQKQCVAQDIACESSAECPAGWLCEQEPNTSTPACNGSNCGAALPAPQPGKQCRPPYYGGTAGGDVSDPATPESGGDGKGTDTPTTGTPNSGDSASGESHDSSACQFGPAGTPSGSLGLLSVLGALFGLARRRRLT